VHEVRLEFSSGKLSLEGVLTLPRGKAPFPAVIVCHPHPLYGGSMDNNVVNGICRALAQASLASFKFNFRGVGKSEGEFGQGDGERMDVEAAVSFITTVGEVGQDRMGIAGYSAGAAFALPVCIENDNIKALAAVSPPESMFDFASLKGCTKPKLLIAGSEDEFIPSGQFLEFCQNISTPREFDLIEGADHFWWGYEPVLANRVTAFFIRVL
jgi:alpha/beta superfamily hydrolase